MKIKKLVVKNYKVFDHLELDFTDKNGDVLDTIVFAGLNGSGKTTLIELIEQLINGTLLVDNLKFNTVLKIEVLISNRNKISSLSNINGLHPTVSVRSFSETEDLISAEFINSEFRPIDIKDTVNEFTVLSKILARSRRIVNKVGAFIDSEFKGILIYASDKETSTKTSEINIFRISFNSDRDESRENILKAVQNKVFENLDKTPQSIFKKQEEDLQVIFKNLEISSKLIEITEKKLVFESINGQKIDFDDLSSGEKMLYFLGFTLNQLNPQDTLIMIDQPEDSLHPTWQQQIVRFFQNIGSNNQVILATHSPQIIASVRPESLFVLGIDSKTRRVTAHNMADEHKHTHGVEPNRILSEIMGTPLRDYETQQKINRLTEAIKQTEMDPSVSNLSNVEKMITTLEDELGKQDAAIMRFNNELRLLKRKMVAA